MAKICAFQLLWLEVIFLSAERYSIASTWRDSRNVLDFTESIVLLSIKMKYFINIGPFPSSFFKITNPQTINSKLAHIFHSIHALYPYTIWLYLICWPKKITLLIRSKYVVSVRQSLVVGNGTFTCCAREIMTIDHHFGWNICFAFGIYSIHTFMVFLGLWSEDNFEEEDGKNGIQWNWWSLLSWFLCSNHIQFETYFDYFVHPIQAVQPIFLHSFDSRSINCLNHQVIRIYRLWKWATRARQNNRIYANAL